jgi:hypothetical protein
MDALAPQQRLPAAVHDRLAALRERGAAPAAAPVRSARAGPAAAGVPPALAQRIAALPADDPERPRKAVRLFLESELARAFGQGVLNDPGFPALLQAVLQQMEGDAQTAGAVAELGRLLAGWR